MKNASLRRLRPWFPVAIGIVAIATALLWLKHDSISPLALREPGSDGGVAGDSGSVTNPVLGGSLIRGGGQPSELPGDWPQFRGPNRNGISLDTTGLARSWGASGPPVLWSLDVGEGYAGAAVHNGRVYLMDYDREKKMDALRCVSLSDGRELWRFAYPVSVKRYHGMSRTVPAIAGRHVVAIGPKCHVVCVDSDTGELQWGLDLVRQFGATVPQWYAGQCPLLDGDKVMLAPGGKNALLMAVDLESGTPLWQSPNPHGWKMTHSSIMPMEFAGRRGLVYCASGGVVGVAADDGSLLWETTAWKIGIATVPSPVPLPDGRIFLTGGYNAGSLMLQLVEENGKFIPRTLFKLTPEVFGATQQTPILKDGNLYGVRADGRFVCLDLDGKVVWTSGPGETLGLGSFLMSDGLILSLNDNGRLRLIEASSARFTLLGQAQVLDGRESWAPLALAGSRLLARDLTQLVCLEVGAK